MTTPQQHRRLRELLGSYALGGLPEDAAAGLRAHLASCPACLAELADIAPLAHDLRGVDVDALSELPAPPPDLGDRIRQRVAEERALVEARARRDRRPGLVRGSSHRVVTAAAVVAVLAGAVGIGTAVGRTTAPAVVAGPVASGPPLPIERVDVRTVGDLRTDTAAVIAHTWGVEARFEGTGFVAGEVYRAAFRAADGGLLPAGEFLGTGEKRLTCNMQSALKRADATGFVVMDAAGTPVLTAEL